MNNADPRFVDLWVQTEPPEGYLDYRARNLAYYRALKIVACIVVVANLARGFWL